MPAPIGYQARNGEQIKKTGPKNRPLWRLVAAANGAPLGCMRYFRKERVETLRVNGTWDRLTAGCRDFKDEAVPGAVS